MALTDPAQLSVISGAVRPRGVYLSGPDKVFAVWTVRGVGGTRFATMAHDGGAGSEFLLPVAPDTIRDFDVDPLTSDHAVVVYDTGAVVKYFVYDYVAGSLFTDTTILDTARTPSMVNDGWLRTMYLKDNVLRMMTGLPGEVADLVSSPAYVLHGHSFTPVEAFTVQYLGTHSRSLSAALPVRADVNSVFVHDFRDDPAALPAFEPQSAGLKAYFKLDDNAPSPGVAEATGLGVSSGTLYENGVGTLDTENVTVPGFKVGAGFGFNGSSYYVSVPDDGALLRPQHISLAAWVNVNSHNAWANVISKPFRTSGWTIPYMSYALRTSDLSAERAAICIAVGGNIYRANGTTPLAPGTTYLLVGTYDGHKLRIYVNGVQEGEVEIEGVIDYSGDSTPLVLGMRSTSSLDEWFNGTSDDIRIYDYALTQDVIDDIYNAGAGAAAPSPYPDGLWDYYFADKSGNGNTLRFLASGAYHTPGVGLRFGKTPVVDIYEWDVPPTLMTMESLFVPSGNENRGRMIDGSLFMGYDAWGRAYWGYVDGGTVHRYLQTRLPGLNRGLLNHVAVTHEWGTASSTKLYVNGQLVPGEWASGAGGTDPALGTITSGVSMGDGDYLVQLSVNSAIKSQADIENYAKGRL